MIDSPGRIGLVARDGFLGHEHEQNDREWDSNSQTLSAIGHFDRISTIRRRVSNQRRQHFPLDQRQQLTTVAAALVAHLGRRCGDDDESRPLKTKMNWPPNPQA